MATRVLAIIYDENFGDSELAIQILFTGCEKYQKNEILVAQLANTHFRRNEYEQAINIWSSVLLSDRSSDFLYDSYLYRNAGIAAATTGKFDLASAFFARGALLRDPDIPAHLQCGFWVDTAFVLFFAQDYENMLQAESVQRQVAIAFILSQQNVSPTYAFWAQAGLFFLFNSLITRDCLGTSLPMIVNSISMSWEAYSKEPALLKNPKLSVAEIAAAVDSNASPLEKLILLLEAASFATGVRLPAGWRDTLRQLLN